MVPVTIGAVATKMRPYWTSGVGEYDVRSDARGKMRYAGSTDRVRAAADARRNCGL